MKSTTQPGTASRSDRIYQLTLTELAFIIIFLILLLTGWTIGQSERDRSDAVKERDRALAKAAELSENGAIERIRLQEESLRRATEDLKQLLAGQATADPNALVSELVRNAGAEAENRRLRRQVEDLDAQLSALEEVRNVVDDIAAGSNPEQAIREQAGAELLSALTFKRGVEAGSGTPITRGQEKKQARLYADALQVLQAGGGGGDAAKRLARENRDLRARAAWMRNQLEARGGRDFPPCWAEEATGKPQYLFTIELREGSLKLSPAWPPERSADAERIPGVAALINAGSLSIPAFRGRVQALDADSKAKNCRHYVRLSNRIQNLSTFNRLRYAVEDYFYKFEVR